MLAERPHGGRLADDLTSRSPRVVFIVCETCPVAPGPSNVEFAPFMRLGQMYIPRTTQPWRRAEVVASHVACPV